MQQYIIDAFTDQPFSGNPAAVCLPDIPLADTDMLKIAAENNLSETAFVSACPGGYTLRWFTPATEVDLCGHATLAAACAVFTWLEPQAESVCFHTRSGPITVRRREDMLEMLLPVWEQKEIPVTAEMTAAFGARPDLALLGTDLVCVFPDEETVRSLTPAPDLLSRLPGRLQNATAPGRNADCASRSFAPALGIAEDPVCGSAHCQIAPFWSSRLRKNTICAEQVSARGGKMVCEQLDGKTMAVRAHAVPILAGQILAFPTAAPDLPPQTSARSRGR
ncbi:MAG: PhzF family phenazine biosynthesis protein [Clostridia bacterium]|nr:PhzF family phenazine biosynthesis protein [Clostridia bacterium]